MKNKKLLFNHLVLQYHKSLGKLKRLSERGLNIRKQNILGKRIERIKQQLLSIKQALKSATAVASMATGIMVMQPNAADAQNFQPPIVNPFSLNLTSDSIGNIKSVDFADLDADGDFDGVVYNNLSDALYIIKNEGTPEIPDFIEAVLMPISLTETETLDNICFGDLDADGDFDLMAGGNSGNFIYFENIGSNTLPEFAVALTNPFQLQNAGTNYLWQTSIFVGENSLEFVDLDNDGDLDIFNRSEFDVLFGPYCYNCNEYFQLRYRIFYLENNGNELAPNFGSPVSMYYNNSGIGDFCDLDMDGDFDYITAINEYTHQNLYTYSYYTSYQNRILFKENIGTELTPDFLSIFNPFGLGTAPVDDLFSPTALDLDNDNDMDLMFLKSPNKFYFFENKICDSTSINLTDGGGIITADQSGVQYQWFEHSSVDVLITGETNQTYSPENSGDYFVQINNGGCFINSEIVNFISCNQLINNPYIFSYTAGIYTNENNAEYQWLNCNNNYGIIEGEINYFYQPINDGYYALELTNGNCKDTTDCINFTNCNNLSDAISLYGNTLTVAQSGANYQWFDCIFNYQIQDETNQSFTPEFIGSYAAEIQINNCIINTECISVTTTGINKTSPTNTFTLVPNPTEGKLNITTDKPLLKATIQITSVTGKIIFEQKNVSGFQFDIDLLNHANGLYFLEVSENGNVTGMKIIKE